MIQAEEALAITQKSQKYVEQQLEAIARDIREAALDGRRSLHLNTRADLDSTTQKKIEDELVLAHFTVRGGIVYW
jgi:hypothetical protein